MAATVEERIVAMKFDNASFQTGVASTLKSLDQLNKGLQLQNGTKGLEGISKAANNQTSSLKSIENGVQSISDKFKTMGTVGIAAITNVTNQAVYAGQNLIKSLSIAPIMGGFHEYETNLNSIQTILANTGLTGQKGLSKVTGALDELNHYSDQTIYNFSEMARNVGTFTAAGVSLKVSTEAIKGIANLAAVSGSNAQQASTAMYQLSQAISAGKVSLEDWNSVVNAGMGGQVFQKALIETAKLHGVAIDKMIKDEGSFRLTLQKGWLTSNILTETLSKFTGDLNAKQLKSMGYNEQQIKEILKMGKIAQDAATKVKTMSQLIDTLQEAVGSGWSQTWKLIFGDFGEAKTTFTAASNVLGGFIERSSEARNKVLGDWKALGGRTILIDGISTSFKALTKVAGAIKDAFREIFPATTGADLLKLTKAFDNFAHGLLVTDSTADKIKRTFAGFFAILGIGWEVIKQVATTLYDLFKTASDGSGGILDASANLGDFLVGLHDAIKNGEGLTNFFKAIGTVLAIPIKLLKLIGSLLASLFNGFDGTAAANGLTEVTSKMSPMLAITKLASAAWNKLDKFMHKVADFASGFGQKISDSFNGVGDSTKNLTDKFKFSDLLSSINTAFFGGLLLLIKKFVNRDSGGGFSGIFEGLTGALEGLTGTLKGMQHALNAAALLEIAIAVGILAVSMKTLANIDAGGLARASSAMGAMMTELGVALFGLQKISTLMGTLKMPLITLSLIALAFAISIMASALKKIADLSWEQVAKGLTGLAGAMVILAGGVRIMPSAARLSLTAHGMVTLAGAVKILVSAVKDLSDLSWNELAKGLVGVGAILLGLSLFSRFSKADYAGVTNGAGIILLGIGLKFIASAMKDFGNMSWGEIAKGLVSMAGALAIISATLPLIPPTAALSGAGVLIVSASLLLIAKALDKMGTMSWGAIAKGLVTMAGALVLISAALILVPPSSILSAAAILVVAGSLVLIADVLDKMGSMDWENIAKALVLLGGSLTIIAVAMIAMLPALPGAAALVIIAGALAVLTPVLIALGNMSWESIAKGLLALAGVFVVLGVAGLVLGSLVPVLIGLGVAITLVGIGVLAAGAGVFLFAAGLTALAAAGAAGAVAIVAIVVSLASVIPLVMKQLGLGIIAFAKVISTAGPALLSAMTTVILAIVKAIDKTGPKIVDTLLKVLSKMLDSSLKYIPKMVDTGFKLIKGILDGVAKNVGDLADSGTDVIVEFIKGIRKNIPRVLQAGFDLIIDFLNGLADSINENEPIVRKAGINVADAIVNGMTFGLLHSNNKVVEAAKNLAKSALDAAKNFLGINSPSKEFEKIGEYVNQGFAKGLKGKSREDVKNAFNDLKGQLKDMMKDTAQDVKDATAKLKELTNARDKDEKAIKKAKKALEEARKEHELSSKAYKILTKDLADERAKLNQLAGQYEKVTARLEKAKDALADARQTRDDYNKNIRDQYSALPDISEDTNLEDYVKSLQKEVRDTQEFSSIIQQLRDRGLNDKAYEDLLSKGITALPFMRQLLAAGQYGVDQVNRLDSQIVVLASNLGKKASTELYQAGVDAAAKLVQGLEAQQDKLEKAMEKLADAMLNAINRALGTMVIYLPDTFKLPRNISPNGNKPVTIPVTYSGLPTGNARVSVAPSYNSASTALRTTTSANAPAAVTTPATTQKSTIYNQYINSPRAVSAAEVYRNTNNLLSVTKEGANAA